MSTDREIGLPARPRMGWFRIGAALIALLLALVMAQGLGRPMIGLHSLGFAHDAWLARSHVQYGLDYTRGFDTFALGHPPPAHPTRYLDHPVLFTLTNALAMQLLGVNDGSLRLVNILSTLLALGLLLALLRRLVDDATALLAGLFFAAQPLIAYFGVNMWLYPLVFCAYLCYLTLLEKTEGAGHDGRRGTRADLERGQGAGLGREPRARLGRGHRAGLAAALFLAIQMSWEGCFFAAAIGLHYLAGSLRRRDRLDRGLLAILLVAPLASLAVNAAVLAAGQGWDFSRLTELARLRMTSGQFRDLGWADWLSFLWQHAVTNFTLPLILLALLYLGARLGAAARERTRRGPGPRPGSAAAMARAGRPLAPGAGGLPVPRFPRFWLFALPPLLQLLLMRGTLPDHVYWERPLAPLIAIAAALALRGLHDRLRRFGRAPALVLTALLTAGLLAGCAHGTRYYYGIRWLRPEMVEMFARLRALTPPDQELLSFEEYVFDQFPGVKAPSLRPEFAWVLDRPIRGSRDLEEIDRLARSGEASYYLIPAAHPRMEVARELARLVPALRTRYRTALSYPERPAESRHLPWFPRAPRYLRPYREGMLPHLLFDLRERIDEPGRAGAAGAR